MTLGRSLNFTGPQFPHIYFSASWSTSCSAPSTSQTQRGWILGQSHLEDAETQKLVNPSKAIITTYGGHVWLFARPSPRWGTEPQKPAASPISTLGHSSWDLWPRRCNTGHVTYKMVGAFTVTVTSKRPSPANELLGGGVGSRELPSTVLGSCWREHWVLRSWAQSWGGSPLLRGLTHHLPWT